MSKTTYPRYIIGIKNLEPAPPEYMYYAGLKSSEYQGKGNHLSALEAETTGLNVIWAVDRNEALQMRSKEELASVATELVRMGWLDGLHVYEVKPSYTLMDKQEIINQVNKRKVDRILSVLTPTDVDYLVEKGVLDLTIVT